MSSMMSAPAAPAPPKKLTKDQRAEIKQQIAQEKMWMLQMTDMMNMQKMAFVQAMQVPLSNMKQQAVMQKMNLEDMEQETNQARMEMMELAKEITMMKQEMVDEKNMNTARKLERLQGDHHDETGN